eukprot:IDg21461t1
MCKLGKDVSGVCHIGQLTEELRVITSNPFQYFNGEIPVQDPSEKLVACCGVHEHHQVKSKGVQYLAIQSYD